MKSESSTPNIEIVENVDDFEMQDIIYTYGRPDTRPATVVLNISRGLLFADEPGFRSPGGYRWDIPALTAAAANAVLRKILPHAQSLAAAHEAGDDDAIDAASREIEKLCGEDMFCDAEKVHLADLDVIVLYPGEPEDFGITAVTTDDEIDAIADREERQCANAAELGGVFCPELRGYLAGLRDELIEGVA